MKKLANLSRRQTMWILAGFTALLTALLAWCTPFFSDDYYFASRNLHSLADFADFLLHYDDSRLLGNGFNILLLQSPALRVIVKALLTAAAVVLPPLALGAKNKLSYGFAFLLVFALNPDMFAQIFAWTSGFQNYVPPLLLLIACYMLWGSADKGSRGWFIVRLIAVLLLALASQLYMEHNAIINALAALTALVFCFIQKKSIRFRLLAALWLVGTLLGAGVLVLLPNMFESLYGHGIGVYRAVHLESLSDCLSSVWSNGLKCFDFLADAVFLCCGLGLCSLALLRREKHLWHRPGLYFTAQAVSLLLPVCVLVRRLLFSAYNRVWLWNLQQGLFGLLCLAFLAVFMAAVAKLRDRALTTRIAVLLALAALSMGAVLVISPLAERCLFLTECFLGFAALTVFDRLAEKLPNRARPLWAGSALALILILSLCLGGEFLTIHHAAVEMEDHIVQCMEAGDTEIKVCNLPSEYVFPNTTTWLGRYYYYEQENDIRFTFTDYSSWKAALSIEQMLNSQ